MRTAVVTMLLVVAAGCGLKHPVQVTPPDWQPPTGLSHCQVEERVRFNRYWRVVLSCPDALLLVDYKTGEVVERVTWEEVRRWGR